MHMKKFFTITLVIILLILCIFMYYRFFWVFGEGVKAGQLNYIVKKGYIFKTYEGRIIQAGFQGGTPGSVQSNEFRFSVENQALAEKLMVNSGKNFELHYVEYKGILPWRGATEFVVDSILSMQGEKDPSAPYTNP
jgi:hypothetical protein